MKHESEAYFMNEKCNLVWLDDASPYISIQNGGQYLRQISPKIDILTEPWNDKPAPNARNHFQYCPLILPPVNVISNKLNLYDRCIGKITTNMKLQLKTPKMRMQTLTICAPLPSCVAETRLQVRFNKGALPLGVSKIEQCCTRNTKTWNCWLFRALRKRWLFENNKRNTTIYQNARKWKHKSSKNNLSASSVLLTSLTVSTDTELTAVNEPALEQDHWYELIQWA